MSKQKKPLGGGGGGKRVGGRDGYYILSGDRMGYDAPVVISCGIGLDCSFDKDMIRKYNATVYAFDPTPKAIEYIKQIGVEGENFRFYPYGISDFDGEADFCLPTEDNVLHEVSGNESDVKFDAERLPKGRIDPQGTIRVQMRKMETIFSVINVEKVDIIKMDIEGSEYKVIHDMLTSGVKFDQLCVELHQRALVDGRKQTEELIEFCASKGYCVIYASMGGEVVTFIHESLL